MLLLASPKEQVTFPWRHIAEHVEEVGDVETHIQGVTAEFDFEFLLGLFLLVVAAGNAQTVLGQHPAHAAEFFVGQDGSTLQGALQFISVQCNMLFVITGK